jgi:hypothetical protein
MYSTADIDGVWSPWSDWSACHEQDQMCGSQNRTRTCTDPSPDHRGRHVHCVGSSTQVKPCSTTETRCAGTTTFMLYTFNRSTMQTVYVDEIRLTLHIMYTIRWCMPYNVVNCRMYSYMSIATIWNISCLTTGYHYKKVHGDMLVYMKLSMTHTIVFIIWFIVFSVLVFLSTIGLMTFDMLASVYVLDRHKVYCEWIGTI